MAGQGQHLELERRRGRRHLLRSVCLKDHSRARTLPGGVGSRAECWGRPGCATSEIPAGVLSSQLRGWGRRLIPVWGC